MIHNVHLFISLFIDFAVGAPFEGSGVVYVYHGQNVSETIVNTTVQQVRTD